MNDEWLELTDRPQEVFKGLNLTLAEYAVESSNYELNYRNFKSTGNGLFAMNAFLQCAGFSIQSPAWVKQWLVQGFTGYMASQDHAKELSDLGKSLGIPTQTKTDRPKPLDTLANNSQIDSLLYLMQELHVNYSMSAAMAADVVWHQECAKSQGMVTISHERLAKAYSDKGCKNNLPKSINRTPANHRELLASFLTLDIRPESRRRINELIELSRTAENNAGIDER